MSTAAALGLAGAVASLTLPAAGAAYGTALAGEAGSSCSRRNDKLGLRCLVPTIMSGVLAIYGLIISVIILNRLGADDFTLADGWTALSAGLALGFSCLFSGLAIGKIARSGIAAYCDSCFGPAATSVPEGATATTPLLDAPELLAPNGNKQVFITMTLNLIFAESIGFYGLIVALIMLSL
eukprot:CAMPEP_0177751118 /NCGR_PEP_ID=MMETSP0491_2-20121128/200_1 /TAXON_ID=63592 /ORGANISM="Tetraselmis chuii, Strain PLY429" /LENGTH=180 /DNA_ID=CAMNT_0019266203 /DNA_START=307 /DNA_END=849 /DNA_ORIENTATION=-